MSSTDKVIRKSPKKKTVEQIYTKKTQLEHILLRPDTYVGSVEKQTQQIWVFDSTKKKMVFRNTTFVPGLYKIFDEIIVNAADNKQRDPSMSRIEVDINVEENSIRIWNNGNGIPVVMHQEHQVYVPELIFGHLLTGSNFDDNEEKTTGGRNGYGAKLANIFSKQFIVETSDKSRGLRFKQVYENNMGTRTKPEISKYGGEDFTCITFYPDLERFKMEYLDEDIVALLSKRVYDIAATNTSPGAKLSVFLNRSRIETRTFEQYIGIYEGLEPPCAFERVSDRWEIGVGVSDGTFQQVSFVNQICTIKGGCHVNYIADQISAKLMPIIKKRNKGQEVKAHQIKGHLAIYVNALIINPAFDSQTKENLTTKSTAFGSVCTVSDKMIKQVEKSGIIDNILNWAKFKQTAELKKKSGSKRSKLVGITKLDDANFAGSGRSHECTLILTEGDSAKALAISGLGVVGRDYYGVFPLKGKLLNVREASHAQIMKNEEIQNIAKILGLTFGKDYEDASSLRYGHLMIMTDQDHDGSHIKGLLINFLHHFWPSLLRIDGFLQQFITPIVKCTKGKKDLTFFTIPQYNAWKEEHEDDRGWKIKYYKGLGTSTAAEAKEYFSHLDTHQIDFEWDDKANDMVDMAFAKKRVDDRKLWLLSLQPGVHIDYDVDKITYDDFVNKELILFSHADNERSIPHFMDGFKPSQRKVLFSCFKRNLRQEIKVAQLAGYISEHSAYHHGEASLTQTIIGMAQNFVGSNNINLLSPCGQFGTRLMGGKDAASPRYVFTKLEAITRLIFHPDDDPLLEYLDDDGQSIEPKFYVPIIPMALVNGSEGIGTGWSTSVPTYNPREIIHNLREMIKGQQPSEMKPWFRGFVGDIQAKTGRDVGNFTVAGIIEQVDDSTLNITELPIGKWTTDYKQFLESSLIGNTAAPAHKEDGTVTAPVPAFVKDFKENHTDTTVAFTVTLPPEKLAEALNDNIYKKFKLETSVATSNMNMFDCGGQIRKFDSPNEVILSFYDVRVEFYSKRKRHLINKLTEDWEKLDNKVRFINAVIVGKLLVSNRKKAELLHELKNANYKTFVEKKSPAAKDSDAEDEDDEATVDDLDKGYDYLLSMKIWSLTRERVEALTAQRDQKKAELDTLLRKAPQDLWLEDLDALERGLEDFEGEIEEAKRLERVAQKKAIGDRAARGGKSGSFRPNKAKKSSYEEEDDNDDDEDFDDDDSDFGAAKQKKKAAIAKKIAAKASSTVLPIQRQGVLIPRKVLAEKPVNIPTSAVDGPTGVAVIKPPAPAKVSTKAPGEKKAPAEKKKPATTTSVFDLDDEEDAPISLAQRILLKAAAPALPFYGSSSSSSLTTVAAAALKPKPAAATKKPAGEKKKTEKVIDLVDSDDENDVDDYLAEVDRPTRAPRAAAKKVYTIDDDESEIEDDDDEEDFDEDEESEFEDETPKPKKKVLSAKPAPAAKAPSPAAISKGVKRFASPKNTSPPITKKLKVPKATAASLSVVSRPPATKKAASSSASATAPAAKKPAAPKKQAQQPKKRPSTDWDDENIENFSPPSVVAPVREGRVRAAAPKSYASFFDGDDDDGEFDE